MQTVATLVSETKTQDSIGQWISTETEREIFCEEYSITRNEWADAGRLGLNPEICLKTHIGNYNDELVVKYQNKRYSVYRTYKQGEEIELYLERKAE